ncbi:MAG TPA: NAD(P)/FAD-dependent oxidoreductase [Candidatus Acidoferrales bacterium]|nr:NAD(P)/FAD-dependent oxidoreductase [Candidatus Acidoferrales bacterium]
MVKEVDVVVAGAGPGGLYAAVEALKRGLSVHVFDKKSVVGIPVKCGEYFPVRKEMEELLPCAGEYMDVFDVPQDAVDNTCKTLRVISPRGKEYEFDFQAFILDRTQLEQQAAREVEKLGGTLQLKTAVNLFQQNGETYVGPTSNEAVKAKVVIAADGFPSKVAKSAGILTDAYMTANNVAINYEYLMTNLGVDQKVTEMYMGMKFAPGGYGWIIPKGDNSANVGIGIRTPYSKRNDGRGYLQFFLNDCDLTKQKLEGGMSGPMIADVLPVDGPVTKTYSSRVLAVGDAAGMVMPTNGGGISTAMITGRIAGQVAADHVKNGVSLSEYERKWVEVLGREMRVSTRLRRLADHFMGNDFIFHSLLGVLGTQGIKDVITCRVPGVLKPFIS